MSGPGREGRSAVLWRFFAASWLLLLLNEGRFLSDVAFSGLVTTLYAGAVFLTGTLILLGLAFLPVLALHRLLAGQGDAPGFPKRDAAVYAAAVAFASAAQGFMLMDRYVYGIYGFHLNGFVWNLVTTKGGVSSMGAGSSTMATFVLIGAAVVAVEAGLLAAILRIERLRRLAAGAVTRKRAIAIVGCFAALLAFDKITYGVSMFRGYSPVLSASAAFPLYIPISFSTLLRRCGFHNDREELIKMSTGTSRMNYPLHPLDRDPARKTPNIVWLVSESLRSDMLDPEIMPAAWAFSERAVRFRRHYSGGNGTRMGMFSMFYGLYGNSYFPCVAELKSPVLMDAIQDSGARLILHTSASFSFPELDKTVFARVPREFLKEGTAPEGWSRDRENVTRILEEIDARDPAKPFFAFMFFESPHAPYAFPEECAIRKPYSKDLNYLTMDLKKDIGTIKNTYVNACRHLDTQIQRVLGRLEERKLLDSTIVVITGDHGEEFMEKGRWGHQSAFTEEQTRVTLILHVPGQEPRVVERLTSHLDLPATILPLLGVRNPASDYSLGQDLLAPAPRAYTVLSGWAEIVYVDDKYKSVFPLKSYDVVRRGATTVDDAPVDNQVFMSECHDRLTQVLQDLRRFQK